MNIEELRKKVEKQFSTSFTTGHDFKHVQRVSFLSRYIAEREGFDPILAEITGLLHDLGRTLQKEDKDHGAKGVPMAGNLLKTYTNYNDQTISEILNAITVHSQPDADGQLAHILMDADKIDGMGAIGLMRGFAHRHEFVDYDPQDVTGLNYEYPPKTLSEHVHFLLDFEKMLYTNTARKIVKPRADYLRQFLDELKREIDESSDIKNPQKMPEA